jgi:hypothetical protein
VPGDLTSVLATLVCAAFITEAESLLIPPLRQTAAVVLVEA